jgi:hypothetical protein
MTSFHQDNTSQSEFLKDILRTLIIVDQARARFRASTLELVESIINNGSIELRHKQLAGRVRTLLHQRLTTISLRTEMDNALINCLLSLCLISNNIFHETEYNAFLHFATNCAVNMVVIYATQRAENNQVKDVCDLSSYILQGINRGILNFRKCAEIIVAAKTLFRCLRFEEPLIFESKDVKSGFKIIPLVIPRFQRNGTCTLIFDGTKAVKILDKDDVTVVIE